MNATTTATRVADWIRPWYPAGAIGHTRPDCPKLLAVQPNPVEGTGWLNPQRGTVCIPCLKADGYPLWDAHCHTCDWSLAEEKADDDASIFTTREEASAWRANHRCEPYVTLTDPNPPTAQPDDQLTLFPLTDMTAERTAA